VGEEKMRTIFVKLYRHENGTPIRLYSWRNDTLPLPAGVVPVAVTVGRESNATVLNLLVTCRLEREEMEVIEACVRQANELYVYHPSKVTQGALKPRWVDDHLVVMEGDVPFDIYENEEELFF